MTQNKVARDRSVESTEETIDYLKARVVALSREVDRLNVLLKEKS